ncbi:hypothetical protein ELE36_01300 [Pseudolysobacter antarcticus]|uniref:Uncharacterized protein n=1 Tax=Pseudolysobacter antarcticus TaxID=2511995 RepID=A0A411HF59_9GAMM|nr:hypothetical protein [Pseudolysobacter antarcticus]QBB69125.1 hypothetical protein ELE36_01300 [Pseudolysobacter antarcticus]
MPNPNRSLLPLCLLVLLLAAPAAFAAEGESTPAAKQAAGASFSAVLQGDGTAALRALATVPTAQYAGTAATYRRCIIERFERATPAALVGEIADPFARAILAAYQDYWWHALIAPTRRDAFSAALLQKLRKLLGTSAASTKEFEALEPILAAQLRKHGYYSLQGETPPLRELMLWHKQETRDYDIVLPEGSEHVTVNLLDDFVSKGWSEYGSCGLGGTGGWTDEKAIFALAPGYPDLQGEDYRVSLLAHEGQHFADKHRTWKLESWELEYRAKLTELALADQISHKLLQAFAQNQSDDLSSPHAYANKRALAAISQRLRTQTTGDIELEKVPLGELRQAARETLIADTHQRDAAISAH